jgi:tetratricopeptide (TPR) repeat protein
VRVIALMLAGVAGLFSQTVGSLAKAEELFLQADYSASLTELRESKQTSAEAYFLIGKDWFMLGDFKPSTEAFERALATQPENAEYALWLARAYGRRAETASPFSAPRYASKARMCFERAVSLNPNSEEALSDLFDYYLEAPGFLGGGFDKAQRIAAQIAALNPADGQFAQARLAEARKQFDTAEEHLSRAIEVAPRQVGRLLDLARYLARQGRVAESEATFDQAEELAPNSPKVVYARAKTYVEEKRNLDRAKALLHQYLQSRLTSEDPSRTEAEKLLREASRD